MKLHRGTPLNNCPNCTLLRRITQQANCMNGSQLCAVKWKWAEMCTKNFTQEDTSNFLKTSLSIFRLNSIQVQPLWWSCTNTYIWCTSMNSAVRSSKYNKQASTNSPCKATQHNAFIMVSCHILSNFSTVVCTLECRYYFETHCKL